MWDKVINICMIVICGMLVVLNHIDRTAFLLEIDSTRKDYVQTLSQMSSDINEIKTGIHEVKTMLKGGE